MASAPVVSENSAKSFLVGQQSPLILPAGSPPPSSVVAICGRSFPRTLFIGSAVGFAVIVTVVIVGAVLGSQAAGSSSGNGPAPITAMAIINNGSIFGTVSFSQAPTGGNVTVSVALTGLPAGSYHGFHVHNSSDLSNGCLASGAHYNPLGQLHGAPFATVRHVGDLGNVQADMTGYVLVTFSDNVISLVGGTPVGSILNRAIMVHRDVDDYGLGGYPDSNTTGHAGPRIACGVITQTAGWSSWWGGGL